MPSPESTSEITARADAVIAALVQGEGARIRALLEPLADSLLGRRIGELIEPEELTDHLLRLLSGEGPGHLIALHLEPGLRQERERARKADERLAEWVPKPVVQAVLARLARPLPLPVGWSGGVLDPAFVQAVLSDALADALEDVVGQLPFGGGAGGLLGSLTRRAGRASPPGGRFGGYARQLGAQSAAKLYERILAHLNSEQHAPGLAATGQRLADAVLALPTADVLGLADDPGIDVVGGWARETLHHNVDRPAVRGSIRTQIAAAIERAADVTLGEELDRLGLLPTLRDSAVARASAAWLAAVETDLFRGWLVDLLTAADPMGS